jgi:hypothetical protein
VEEAIVTVKSEQTLVCVTRPYQLVHGHEVPLQWETKDYMQMEQDSLCRPCRPGACCSLQVVASNLQVQEEACKCNNLCSLIGVSSNLEYKQWDPGIRQKEFECFLNQDQQIHAAKFLGCSYAAFRPSNLQSHCLGASNVSWGR